MSDFPAAHSMDTEWFAVDEHGNVGLFYSGEDGAVPVDAATGLDPADGSLDIDAIQAARLARMLANGKDPVAAWDPPPARRAGRTLVVMDPADSYRNAPNAEAAPDRIDGDLVRVGDRLPLVFLSAGELSLARVEQIAARAGVRWVLSTDEIHEALVDVGGDGGLFLFKHEHGEDPAFYARAARPERPLALDDFPDAERAKIAALRLPVDFAEQDVHLADLLKPSRVATWGDLPLRYRDEWPAEQETHQKEREPRPVAETRRAWVLPLVLLLLGVFLVLALGKGVR